MATGTFYDDSRQVKKIEIFVVYVAYGFASSTPLRNYSAAVRGAILARLIGRTVPFLLQPEVPRRHGSPSEPEFFV